MRFLYFSIIFFFNFHLICAQFSSDHKEYKEKYPNAHLVRLNEFYNVEIKLINGKISIEEEVYEENILLSKSAKYSAKKELSYSSFSDIENLKASSVNFKEGKYQELNINNFIKSDKFGDSFYDDLKKVEFIYPGLTEGSKTKLSYIRKINNPRFLNGHFFGDLFPKKNNTYQITVDNNIELDFKQFNIDDSIDFSKKVSKKKTVYRWQAKNVEAVKVEEDAPAAAKEFPHIIPYVKQYTYKGETIQVSGTIDNLYSWYYSLVQNLDDSVSDNLKETVLKLVENKSSDLEKVRAIYYWAQENIKYIAFEYALGGFVPRNANEVFEKKYGDCKDNSSILKSMLKIAGLQGNLTWIGTRDIPYTYEELPTPAVDNHMILSYESKSGETYFLDATGRYMSLELPTAFIQGKEALIGKGKDNYSVKKVPVVDSKANYLKDSVNIKFNGKTLVGKAEMRLKGYPKTDIFNILERITSKQKLKDYYTLMLRKGSNRFLIDDFEEVNKFSYDNDFTIKYAFNVKDYIQQYENEFYVNMNLFTDFRNFRTEDDRKQGKDYEYQNFNEMTAVLEVPQHFEITFIPEDLEIATDLFDCKIKYFKKNSNQLVYTLTVEQKFITLTREQQLKLNEKIKEIDLNYKNVVVLKKKN